MTEYMHHEVARLKKVLLATPVTAYSKAFQRHRQALADNDGETAEIWAQVVCELEAEGYAPTESGQDGPAVKAHYEAGVLGTIVSTASSLPSVLVTPPEDVL